MDSKQSTSNNTDNSSSLRILIAEDNELDRLLIERELKKSVNSVNVCVDRREDFIKQLNEFKPDIILCDYSIPQFGALEALKILKELSSTVPLIIVTGTLTDELAVECLKKGASDYVIKDKIVRLASAIKLTLDLKKSKQEKDAFEELLRRNEEQLKVITDVLPASLTYICADFTFQFSNKANKDWFGKNIEGAHVRDILGEDVFINIQKNLDKLKNGQQLKFESTLPENGNAPRFVDIDLIQDSRSEGEKGYVCLITNITERKLYENNLKTAKKEAESANSAKSQFLANMSHEIRTPLNAIMGLSELLLTENPDGPERASWLKKIVHNSEHLKKVIDEILDLSKIEAGKLQIEVARFPISQTMAQVKSILSPLAAEKNLDITFNVKGEIPEFVHSDSSKLQHILLNLIGNAIKFSTTGPITVEAAMENDKFVFSITDHGIGMTADQAKHLFEPFTQVDNSMTRRFGGTGLGLALAKQLALALGGDVTLSASQPGVGSTFKASFEAGNISQVAKISKFNLVSDPHENIDSSMSNLGLNDLNVLLVEDSIDNQIFIHSLLERQGVHVDLASDGKEGIEKALAGNYDLILMDVQMPVMDGYNATSHLRHAGYKKPIIAFTAHAFQDEKDRCLEIGFDDFLSKPIRKNELLSCVSKYKKH